MATKPNSNIATTTTTTTTTDQTSKDTCFADAVKRRPTHQQLVERQPDFPVFPYAKPGNLRKAMQGARIRTSAVRDIRWISRQITARIYGGKTLEAATVEATKIRVQTPGFDISTNGDSPKESLPVKKATDKESAAPAVDSTIRHGC
ncbi:hypothetical protein BASA83_009359 [Batrachochytrium salamandrivorans]|nr:hypothetical protein BASA83_009359 [Batrachochytrium salamandrivorans]